MIDHRPQSSYVAGALAIAATTGVYGISFGALAVAAGLTVAKACALSALVFTGGSQFAAVAVVASGGTVTAAIGNAILLGARNVAYGFVTAPVLRPIPRGRRLLATHLVIDETTAMSVAQKDARDARGAFLLTGIALFACWNIGTCVGAIAGDRIGDPATYGLDAMFPAAFVALLAPQLRRRSAPAIALTGALIATLLVPVTPVGVPVLASVVALGLGARRLGERG